MSLKAFVIFSVSFCLATISCKKGNKILNEPDNFNWERPASSSKVIPSLDSLIYNIKNGEYGNIDELFIAKGNEVLVEESFDLDYNKISKEKSGKMGCGYQSCLKKEDIHEYNYYHPRYHPYYKASKLHTLQSISKSVLSTLIGYAVTQEHIGSVENEVLPYFLDLLNKDDSMYNHLKNTTVEDLLNMRAGIEWEEMGMSLEQDSDVSLMERSADWLEYVLNKNPVESAGDSWNYNSGVTQLLAYILQRSSGKDLEKYAMEGLFKELGIKSFHWKKTPKGRHDAEGGMYLSSQDLAKIGKLYLQNGVWQGKPIINEQWIAKAVSKHSKDLYQDGGDEGYGYQWWLTGPKNNSKIIGLGYGNQILVIDPSTDIVAVVYAWNVFDDIEAKYILSDLLDLIVSY